MGKGAMWLALKSMKKLKFIDGSLPKPDRSDPLFEAWDRCNMYIVFWINLFLSFEIFQSVNWHYVAFDLWKDLKH